MFRRCIDGKNVLLITDNGWEPSRMPKDHAHLHRGDWKEAGERRDNEQQLGVFSCANHFARCTERCQPLSYVFISECLGVQERGGVAGRRGSLRPKRVQQMQPLNPNLAIPVGSVQEISKALRNGSERNAGSPDEQYILSRDCLLQRKENHALFRTRQLHHRLGDKVQRI
jgi:hypothetical protein